MDVDASLLPVIVTNVLTAAVLGGVIWSRVGSVEGEIRELGRKVDQQNGRIGSLEEWKAAREGYRRGLEDGKADTDG